ncbi:holin [Salmonella enterica subsp. enterica serovar Montevideo]|nr:holin [Salmonella enterica]EDM3454283.1 holin [Salmonella enterica subsp. enterica serovar Montevideo]ECR9187479.1 holin [Salmonella enterica]EEN9822033.1 holin [Salmonella enterica]EGG6836095.1 holin [Salmonella enterica]
MDVSIPLEASLLTWAFIGFFSAWGGVVGYLINMQEKNEKLNFVNIITQVVISTFTGILGGFVSFEYGTSSHMTFVISGIFSTMGASSIKLLWSRFVNVPLNNK